MPGASKVGLALLGVVVGTETVWPDTVGNATCSMGITVHLVPPGVVVPGAAEVVAGTAGHVRPASGTPVFVVMPSPVA